MRYKFLLVAFAVAIGCNGQPPIGPAITSGGLTQDAAKPDPSAEMPSNVGTVASIKLADKKRPKDLNSRLHFCVFENGDSDYIFVGTNYGMWSDGEFDLTIDGKVIFTGNIKRLIYEGVVIQMGDVLAKQPESNIGVNITRVTGFFK